jgi:hypothetical protein
MKIIVTGLIGQYPLGGVVWDYIQYMIGFRDLGHEVYYLEDSGAWPYDPINNTITDDCTNNLKLLSGIMKDFGFQDNWIYRNGADMKFHGAGEEVARDLIKNGDLLLNVSSAGWLKDYEMGVKHKMFIDGDPMFHQIGFLEEKNHEYTSRVREHDSHFTFGLKINDSDTKIPNVGINWKTTVQPISLSHWKQEPKKGKGLTTVMNWVSYDPKEFQGDTYGQKDKEFLKFIDLPSQLPDEEFVMVMGKGKGESRPTKMLEEKKWKILEPEETVPNHQKYKDYLSNSKAEWSIAKEGYVKGRTGWFSCRSACYLAAGVPVIVQDTGWSDHLPAGKGILKFSNVNDCIERVRDLNENYEMHQTEALKFAEKYLDASVVCQDLLKQADLI